MHLFINFAAVIYSLVRISSYQITCSCYLATVPSKSNKVTIFFPFQHWNVRQKCHASLLNYSHKVKIVYFLSLSLNWLPCRGIFLDLICAEPFHRNFEESRLISSKLINPFNFLLNFRTFCVLDVFWNYSGKQVLNLLIIPLTTIPKLLRFVWWQYNL